MSMRFIPLCLALAFVPAPAAAQDAAKSWPADWQVRLDRSGADASALNFETMEPGWHITTGPSGIMYKPEMTASGNFRVESETHLFPGQRREAFGIFVGGDALDSANQSYVYFLVRGDGQYLIKRRTGSETETLVSWTGHDAVTPHDGGEGTVKNVLAIEAGSDQVRFLVNGTEVASLPRAELAVDGVVGLRVNHNLNIHVTSLEVERGSS